MDVELTRDAKAALALLYEAYMERRQCGKSKSEAVCFEADTPEGIAMADKISESKSELERAGFIKEDITGNIKIEDKAIVYMENKTSDTIKEWLSYVPTISSILSLFKP